MVTFVVVVLGGRGGLGARDAVDPEAAVVGRVGLGLLLLLLLLGATDCGVEGLVALGTVARRARRRAWVWRRVSLGVGVVGFVGGGGGAIFLGL